ncbi:MAG: hypothetical protein PHD76_04755 [Methylacidiphilales bacterium]|nr:hypothetical protein [Candidatus Methylacidiphilales bacterium]
MPCVWALFFLLTTGSARSQNNTNPGEASSDAARPAVASEPVVTPVLPTPPVPAAAVGEAAPPASTPPSPEGAVLEAPQPIEVSILYPHDREVVAGANVDIFFDVKNCALAEGGNALRVIVNNRLPITLYSTARPLTLGDLREGGQTIRAYVARSDGTIIRDPKGFAMTHFYIKKKDFQNYVDPTAPFLTVNLPSGETLDTDAENRVCFDYLIQNAGAGGDSALQVHYSLPGYDGSLSEPGPVYWSNIPVGKHRLVVELFDKNGHPLFGAFNRVERIFEVRQMLKAKPYVPEKPAGEEVPQG